MILGQNCYPYGKDNLDEQDGKIVIHYKVSPSNNRPFSSLEGYFVSMEPLLKPGEKINKDFEYIIERDKMEEFEEEYKGKFEPFRTRPLLITDEDGNSHFSFTKTV